MKLRLSVHQVWLGGRQYRVIQPRVTPPHATLRDGSTCHLLQLDRATAWEFAGLWDLAARSPHSILYLPIRGNAPSQDSSVWPDALRALDLVLVHHSLQLRPSAWPRIRRRLGTGRPQTADLPNEAVRTRAERSGSGPRNYDTLNRFVHHLHAETLFLTGSAVMFGSIVGEFIHVADHPSTHPEFRAYCAEFDIVDKPRWPIDVTELFIGHTENWSP